MLQKTSCHCNWGNLQKEILDINRLSPLEKPAKGIWFFCVQCVWLHVVYVQGVCLYILMKYQVAMHTSLSTIVGSINQTWLTSSAIWTTCWLDANSLVSLSWKYGASLYSSSLATSIWHTMLMSSGCQHAKSKTRGLIPNWVLLSGSATIGAHRSHHWNSAHTQGSIVQDMMLKFVHNHWLHLCLQVYQNFGSVSLLEAYRCVQTQ